MANAPEKTYYESNPFSRWWRRGLSQMVLRLMPTGWEAMRLLDVGVGDGYTIRLVKPEGEIHGLDFDQEEVALARARGVEATVGTAFDIRQPDASFDLITSLEVVEHLENPAGALREMRRVLRQEGFLILTTPVPNLRWKMIWWVWTKLGPGKRWDKIPHVSEMHIGDGSSDGTLSALLSELGLVILKTDRANFGMVAGLLAQRRS